MSFYTGTQSEIIFANGFAYPIANASSAAAQNLLAAASGKNQQPYFPGGFFQFARAGQVVSVDFSAILAGQATPTTAIFTAGLSTTSGAIGGTTLAASNAFTITSFAAGVVYGRILINCFGAGFGTGASGTETNLWSTIMCGINNGGTTTNGGVALGGPTNVTSIDMSVNQWLYLTVTFSTSSTSNTCTVQQLAVAGLN